MKTKFFSFIILLIFSFVSMQNAGAQTFNWLWAKTIQGLSTSSVSAIAMDDSGNVYMVGSFKGIVDINPGPGLYNLQAQGGKNNLFILKLTSFGEFIWAKSIVGNCNLYANAIALDAYGNAYITGNFNSGSADFNPGPGINILASGSLDVMFITKFGSTGNFIFAKAFSGVNSKSIGNSIAIDPAHKNVYVTGLFRGSVDFNPGTLVNILSSNGSNASDIFVLKLDSLDNFAWAKGMGGGLNDIGTSIALGDENIYIIGNFEGIADFNPGVGTFYIQASGSNDIFITKLTKSGDFLWAVQMGGSGSDYGNAIALDDSENVYSTGYFELTADFYPGPGGYFLTSLGQDDIFISKLDSTGNFIWANGIGGISNDQANSIAIDRNGNGDVWTTGQFYNTVDFNPGPDLFNLSTNGNSDIFISRLNSSGDFVWANSKGGIKNDKGTSIIMDDSSNAFIAGNFYSPTIWFTNLIDTNSNFQGYTTDSYIGKLSCSAAVTVNILACQSYTSPSGNYTWTTSGFYTDTLYTISGCDSLILINLSIGTVSTTSTQNIATCYYYVSPSTKYTWITSGTYQDTVPNASGCDSVITINLTINNSTNSSITAAACHNYTSPSGNHLWSISGIYTDTLTNANGCDSIITVSLLINETYSILSDTGCNNYLSPSGNYNWIYSGTFNDTIPNAAGCDSVMTINLILKKSYSSVNATGCSSYISPSGNYTWTTNGTYKDTIVNSSGCDSIMTIHLTLKNSSSTQFILTCYSYTPPSGNFIWVSSGVYHDSIPNAFGCDSIITYNVTIKTVDTAVIQVGTTLYGPLIGGSFQWLDCDNGFVPIPGAINYAFSPPINGNYAIQVTQNNCIDTSACYNVTGVGIPEINVSNLFEIYPNPATDKFTVDLKYDHEKVEVRVTDIMAKAVYEVTVSHKRKIELNTGIFASGVYILEVKSESIKIRKRIIILKH